MCAGNIELVAVSILNDKFAVLEALYRNNGSASSLHVLHSGDVREVSLGVYDGDSLAVVVDVSVDSLDKSTIYYGIRDSIGILGDSLPSGPVMTAGRPALSTSVASSYSVE